MLIRFQVITNC